MRTKAILTALAAVILLIASNAAYAQCTPSGMARFHSLDSQISSLERRIRAGDCSLIPEWKRKLAAIHAVLRRSQRQTVPYTCHVTIKYPPVPSCGSAAKKKKTRTQTAAAPVPASAGGGGGSGSCSDITGTSSGGPAPTNCKTANNALKQARQVRQGNPAKAAAHYKEAAAAARRAGDKDLELTILREAAAAAAAIAAPDATAKAMPPPAKAPMPKPDSSPVQMASRTPPSGATQPPVSGIVPLADQHYWKGTSDRADCASASDLERQSGNWKAKCGQYGERIACLPLAPAKYWQGTPNADYCANANCVDRGSAAYGVLCYPPSSEAADGDRAGGSAPRRKPVRHEAPRRFKGRVAPDVADQIRQEGEAILALAEDDPNRPPLIRKLMRLAADHGMPLPPDLLACLQPQGASGKGVDIPLRWHPYHIKKEAIDGSHLCDGVADGDAKDACREEKYGQAVMWAEPEIAGQCRTAEAPNNKNVAAVAECAKRKFLNAWAHDGMLAAPTPSNGVLPAACGAKATPQQRAGYLRDLLRALLARANDDTQEPPPVDTQPAVVANPPPSPPPAPPLTDENEAYCNYMAREVVRGELTPSPATAVPAECRATIAAALAYEAQHPKEPFSMKPDETDREIKRMLGSAGPPPPTISARAPAKPGEPAKP
jgi:hypothetical protein